MSIPQPPIDLEGHCSAINNNTLYVLSPGGFQSLPLQKHAKWAKEANGVSVTGPACVYAAPNGDEAQAALWVIGGTTDNSVYSGLQRYTFASKQWETLDTPVPLMQGRTDHGAAFLQDEQSILVYAGSQPDAPSYLSSQTFIIPMEAPYTIQSYTSMAPTAHLPILEPFNTSHAVMAGGSELNTAIFTFSMWSGWQYLGVNLPAPLDSNVRGTIVDGSDGSKVLEVYDMTVSPNQITELVLLGAGGLPAYTGQTVGNNTQTGMRRRDLTLDTWPQLNTSNVPSAKRTDYSVSQSSTGTAVIAGGSSDTPVSLFDQNDNSWIDASQFFSSKQQKPLKPSSSITSTSTPTATTSSTPSATTSAPPITGSTSAHDRMLKTLGITLGVLCGIAAIFILILLFLRYRKLKKKKQEGYLNEKDNEEHRMSFADRGASFMKEAGGSVNEMQPPRQNYAAQNGSSHSSLAIIAGKFGKRTSNHIPKDSQGSTADLVRDKNGSEPMELVDIEKRPQMTRRMTPRMEVMPPAAQYGPTLTAQDAEDRDAKERRKRSSGWSKYFATSQPSDRGSHLPSAYNAAYNSNINNTNRNLRDEKSLSELSAYSNERIMSHPSTGIPSSAMVIDFDKHGHRLSHVATGSPAFNDSREDLTKRGSLPPEGQKGIIVDPSRRRSKSESLASSYDRSTMSSSLTAEFMDNTAATPWTPTNVTSFKDHLNNRPPSSTYTVNSENRVPSRGKSAGFFPGAGTSYRPPKSPKNRSTTQSGRSGTSGISGTSSTEWPKPPTKVQPVEDRDSTVTVFPRGVPSAYYAGREEELKEQAKPVNSDLGWLNLGLNKDQSRI